MTALFLFFSLILIISAIGAMSLRNLVHCALCLAVSFAALGGLFIMLGAEFVGLVQILIYVGAIAVLIVFAILLVRGSEIGKLPRWESSWKIGLIISFCVFMTISLCIYFDVKPMISNKPRTATVDIIGKELMTDYILPLEVVGLLLTAAMIGAVLLAMRDRQALVRRTGQISGTKKAEASR